MKADLCGSHHYVFEGEAARGEVEIAREVRFAEMCAQFLARCSALLGHKLTVRRKRDAWWWRLWPDAAHTTLGYTLWLDELGENAIARPDGLVLLAEEVRHWQQRNRLGRVRFGLAYAAPHWLSIGFAVAAVATLCAHLPLVAAPLGLAAALFLAPVFRGPRVGLEADAMAVGFLVKEALMRAVGTSIDALAKHQGQWMRDKVRSLARGYWLPADGTSRAIYYVELDLALARLERGTPREALAIIFEAEQLMKDRNMWTTRGGGQ